MTCSEKQKIEDIVIRIRIMLVAPEFGTAEQINDLDDIADELELLIRN